MLAHDLKKAGASSSQHHGSLIIVERDKQGVPRLVCNAAASLEDLPHPWEIQLSEDDSNEPEIYQSLVDLHTRRDLQVGDRITGIQQACLTNVGYVSKIFAGEYSVSQRELSSGKIQQTLTRLPKLINANIRQEIPAGTEELKAELKASGHVLLRTASPVDEAQVLELLGHAEAMDYRYGNTARDKVKGSSSLQVTPWAKELMLPAHNEMTYHLEFPQNIAFLCKEPSEYGGETSIYDCAQAFKALSPSLQEKVLHHDVICCKRYVEQVAHNRYPSWQQVLGEGATGDQVVEHFVALGYDCELLQEAEQGGMMTVVETRLRRPMVYRYHGQLCLHASMFPLVPYWYGQIWPGKVPPLVAIWDNGDSIMPEEFHELHGAMLSARVSYGGWQQHDVLILDNPRFAHGRLPFMGDRVIGVLMTQPAHFALSDNNEWQVVVAQS